MVSESDSAVSHPAADMRLPAGIALIVASLLSVFFMAHHPTAKAHGVAEFMDALSQIATINRIVHGGLIGLTIVLLCGYSFLAACLGTERILPRCGLILYAVGTAGVTAAALINGFIISDFLSAYQGHVHGHGENLQPLLVLCHAANSVCTRLGVIGTSLAILLWSVALTRYTGLARLVGALGILMGMIPLIALAAALLHLNVSGLLVIILCEAIWGLAVGVLMIRKYV